jgi:hypothetical protein
VGYRPNGAPTQGENRVLRTLRHRAAALAAAALVALAAHAAAAQAPSWAALEALDTVEVATTDPDGEPRLTTVWLAVVDGQGYVRTGGTRWGDNAERAPSLELVAGAERWPLRVELVEDDALRARIAEAFRAKYGWSDAMLSWVRGSRPRIMRLLPRE